jgi:Fe-S-cluster-containing dehydrogenase component
MKLGMLINLIKCVGCNACVVKCAQEHFLPAGILWGKLLVGEKGKYPRAIKVFYPVVCNHCEEAACVDVCPTGASQKREDGIVWIDADKCVGCRYCVVACPYQMRTYYDEEREYYPGQGLTDFEKIGKQLYPHELGTVIKCNFCMETIDAGLKNGFKLGKDQEATPACVRACPSKARVFGDLDDLESEINVLIRKYHAEPLRPEFGTKPNTYYVVG